MKEFVLIGRAREILYPTCPTSPISLITSKKEITRLKVEKKKKKKMYL